jgi:hypothetical protein
MRVADHGGCEGAADRSGGVRSPGRYRSVPTLRACPVRGRRIGVAVLEVRDLDTVVVVIAGVVSAAPDLDDRALFRPALSSLLELVRLDARDRLAERVSVVGSDRLRVYSSACAADAR